MGRAFSVKAINRTDFLTLTRRASEGELFPLRLRYRMPTIPCAIAARLVSILFMATCAHLTAKNNFRSEKHGDSRSQKRFLVEMWPPHSDNAPQLIWPEGLIGVAERVGLGALGLDR